MGVTKRARRLGMGLGLVLCLPASLGVAQTDTTVPAGLPETTIEVPAEPIDATRQGPDEALTGMVAPASTSLITVRQDFIDQVLMSAEDL